MAAEILLLYYENLAARSQAEPLPDTPRNGWHPLHERLSHREQTLDEDLTDLGISPHPRVVLAVEGETEQAHVPLIWKELDYPDAPELMRLLMLGGVDRDLEKVAALAAAPLVGQKAPSQKPAWLLIKPPTCLYIAVDPEGQYFASDNVARTRTAILNEIRAVLRAQGVTATNPAELGELVRIRTWSASCYEFAHFTDDELADGIMAVHTAIHGWTRDELVAALAYWRGRDRTSSGSGEAADGTSSSRERPESGSTRSARQSWQTPCGRFYGPRSTAAALTPRRRYPRSSKSSRMPTT
jgi:hypothetical protein